MRWHPVRVLLVAALAVPLLAFWPKPQGDAATDWAKEVDRAANSPRYGLRLAAARKLADAGADAVPAIDAFAQKHGRNTLPAALVEAIADRTTLDAPVVNQLVAWAKDEDFYWRSAAMRGLALRAPKLPDAAADLRALMQRFRDDPAWLMRCHARVGLVLLGDDTVLPLPEDDPRAATRLTGILLGNGALPPLQPLLQALADERTFLGVPWAQANAKFAYDALKAWLGDGHPLAKGGSFEDTHQGLVAIATAASKKSGQQLVVPEIVTDGEPALADGFELLSCKHGDVFVRWTADGVVHWGLDGKTTVAIAPKAWQELAAQRKALVLGGDLGTVVCDALRLRWTEPAVHVKVAPRSLPATTTVWLQQLARAIEEAGSPRLAETLRTGIGQFAES